jgi:mannose-6-phosphate isomerase-like protein (cupin superfamily)
LLLSPYPTGGRSSIGISDADVALSPATALWDRLEAQPSQENSVAGYLTNIEKKTLENECFREVLFTGPHVQLVVMALRPGEDIGLEVHADTDQFIRVEAGHGTAVLDGKELALEDGSAVVIPAGTKHNIVNASANETLKLYTIYSPPEHPDGTVHRTRAEAQAYEREHHH